MTSMADESVHTMPPQWTATASRVRCAETTALPRDLTHFAHAVLLVEMCCLDKPYSMGTKRWSEHGVAFKRLRPDVPSNTPPGVFKLLTEMWREHR